MVRCVVEEEGGRVVMTYFLVSQSWISCSDWLMTKFFDNPDLATRKDIFIFISMIFDFHFSSWPLLSAVYLPT